MSSHPTPSSARPSIVHSTTSVIVAPTEEFPRHSEGDLVELKDGRLLFAWSRKVGGEDTSEGCIVGLISNDNGATWPGEPKVIRPVWDGVADVMSVSFCRSSRGLHLFFLARLANPPSGNFYSGCNRVFQIISTDEGQTWSAPTAVSTRFAYTILNNARALRISTGRMILPVASVPGSIFDFYNEQRVYCLISDDEGQSWRESNELAIIGTGLMEPGVAESGDGSLYMSIRTKTGYLYEAKSYDGGAYWSAPQPSSIASAEAPSTVVRAPHTGEFWLLWCHTPYTGKWFERHHIGLTISRDSGATWSEPVTLEYHPDHSFGYISALFHHESLLITYYDWPLDRTKPNGGLFHHTSIRLRNIPLKEIEREMGSPSGALR